MAPQVADGADDLIAQLDAQAAEIGDMLESRIDEIDTHWRNSGSTKVGAQPKSGASAPAATSDKAASGGDDGDDLIAALDAQAEKIGDMLESRLEEIDSHWRHSGGQKPGAIAKSGVQPKGPPQAPGNVASLGAIAKGGSSASTSLGAAAKAKAPATSSLGAVPKGPPDAPPPPWRRRKLKGPPANARGRALPFKAPPAPGTIQVKSASKATSANEEDEPEYDPFSEAPAEHLAEGVDSQISKLVKAAQAECQRSVQTLQVVRAGMLSTLSVPPASGVSLAAMKGILPQAVSRAVAFARPRAKFGGVSKVPPTQLSSGADKGKGKGKGKSKGKGKGKHGARAADALKAAKEAALLAADVALAASDDATARKSTKAATASWLSRGNASKRRMDEGAQLAKEYFSAKADAKADDKSAGPSAAAAAPSSGPAAKRARGGRSAEEPQREVFARALMEKAPPAVQTCRSLLTFLEKKIAGAEAPPAVVGPQDLQVRLETYSRLKGRLQGLRATSGWDARAKRVLDIVDCANSAPGKALLTEEETSLEALSKELAQVLKERGEKDLDASTEQRCAWEREAVKREWFSWCAKLLRSQEARLLETGDAKAAAAAEGDEPAGAIGAVDVLQAILVGKCKAKGAVG
eukprot:TRINITY_DN216_c0_g5_i1.p1 TRINITY_DN216_c0_g5~~TRINITY_DN216_c0_g5_i1.p1  ORF type:complete len:636 (-),score=172.90 TRINITY_DN216_c0_g5_i1:97-2004(-)